MDFQKSLECVFHALIIRLTWKWTSQRCNCWLMARWYSIHRILYDLVISSLVFAFSQRPSKLRKRKTHRKNFPPIFQASALFFGCLLLRCTQQVHTWSMMKLQHLPMSCFKPRQRQADLVERMCVPYHSFGSSGFLSGSLGCIQSKKVVVYFFSNQKRAFHTKTHMKRMQLFIFLNHYKDFLVFPDSQVPSPYESWCLRRRKGRNQGGQYQKLFRFPVHDF